MRKLLISILALSLLAVPTARAQALPEIDPGYNNYIIPDSDFIGGFDIRAEDVQAFLEEQGEDCEGDLCLKNYRDEDTGQTAAEIIHKYAHELALNPYVLLITLQKEKSLVTSDGPEEWQYRTAMGYGCPDGADCDSDFFGFYNQVRLGATLLRVGYDRACGDRLSFFKWYVHPHWAKGSLVPIDGRPTYIGNCATASLYNYTPHRVDGAWIDTDGVYFYGNYNFVILYQRWLEFR